MERDFLHLANIANEYENFNTERCIICQKQKTCKLTSTPSGREKIINAAEIRKDCVYHRLRSQSLDREFLYHVDNECYKQYTMKRIVEKIKQKTEKYIAQASSNDEKDEQSMEPGKKRTRYIAKNRYGRYFR